MLRSVNEVAELQESGQDGCELIRNKPEILECVRQSVVGSTVDCVEVQEHFENVPLICCCQTCYL